MVRDAAVDGFVLYSLVRDSPVVASVLARGLPHVVVDQPRLPGVPFVGIDDEGAARRAAEHLLAFGHRRFAVLSLKLAADGSDTGGIEYNVALALLGLLFLAFGGGAVAVDRLFKRKKPVAEPEEDSSPYSSTSSSTAVRTSV